MSKHTSGGSQAQAQKPQLRGLRILMKEANNMRELLTELRDELHDHNDGTPNTEWMAHYVWRINDLLKGGQNNAD